MKLTIEQAQRTLASRLWIQKPRNEATPCEKNAQNMASDYVTWTYWLSSSCIRVAEEGSAGAALTLSDKPYLTGYLLWS